MGSLKLIEGEDSIHNLHKAEKYKRDDINDIHEEDDSEEDDSQDDESSDSNP